MTNKSMKILNILLEPTADCNLRCLHCYHAKTNYLPKKMSLATLERFLQITAPNYESVHVIWHGGEPTLMGAVFFREAYKLFQKASKKYKTEFTFGVQTNGTLLTEELIDIFKETNTKISISYDGPYNDVLRQQTEQVERTFGLLNEKGVSYSCLSVVSSHSVNDLVALYHYFKEKGVPIKFNPIYLDGAAKDHQVYALTKEAWLDGFIKLFDAWFYDTDCNISVASCEAILQKYLGYTRFGCLSNTCLYRYLAVDAFGDLYPCGRTIEDGFLLGNVAEYEDIRQAFLSENYKKLLNGNMERIQRCKASCQWFEKCHGGCNADATIGGRLDVPLAFDCYFTKNIFLHLEKMLKNLEGKEINPNAKKYLCKDK